jgi:DNA-directed RNA polymerase subunit RPC12/RpoP
MDINFKCPHCSQDLSVDESNAGSETQCPACNGTIVIPAASSAPGPGSATGPSLNPMATSAAAREPHKHFAVPQHEKAAEALIAKPLKPLDIAAKEGITLRVKTLRHSDHVEVGKDHFDEHLGKFLNEIGEANIVKLEPIVYTHQDLASRQWITDYGMLIVYRG